MLDVSQFVSKDTEVAMVIIFPSRWGPGSPERLLGRLGHQGYQVPPALHLQCGAQCNVWLRTCLSEVSGSAPGWSYIIISAW